jgi:microcystin degradation protein MlrC
MKIFAGGIATETNTFAPAPTGLAAYEEHGIHRRSTHGPRNEYSPMLDALERLAAAGGHELVIGLAAYATPGGVTVRAAYESLRDELLLALRAALPVDAVILPLHGAMVADGYPDCEGDLIGCIRAIVGPDVPIGVELDLHCHFTEAMRTQADVIVAYKEYPHTDIVETLEEVWKLTLATALGHVVPVTAVADCRMLGLWHTTRDPMRAFVRRMKALDGRHGVLSVSFGHGFEYGDVPEAGAKVWVIADANVGPGLSVAASLASELAARLARELWDMREAARSTPLPLDAALDRVLAAPPGRPLVIADTADNAGGGAASDSTFVLRRLLERGIGQIAIGAFWDLAAVHICREVGVGATLDLRIGGKCGPASGDPVDLRVTVRMLADEHSQTGLGAHFPCGPSAWVSTADGIDIVLVSTREQVIGTDLFTGLGIDLAAQRAVVVKSSQHFHAAYAPIAQEVIYADTPGLLRSDLENIPFRHRSLNFWPRVADPWAVAGT